MQVEHVFFFGKRKRLPDQPAEPLPNSVVQPFDMCRLPGFLAHLAVGGFGDAVVRSPKVTETAAAQVSVGQFPPKPLARLHRAVADEEGKYLAGLPALGYPDTGFVEFQKDKGENLVHFDDIARFGFGHRQLERGQGTGFFFNLPKMTVWLTPKMRPVPRRLCRSQ